MLMCTGHPLQKDLADILSVLAMTAAPGSRDTLKYRLASSLEDVGGWGHEYVRCVIS